MKPLEDGEFSETEQKMWLAHEAMKKSRAPDQVLLERALAILHRMATEKMGWRRFFSRWYYSDEPLRNDAANLVREAGFGMPMPHDSCLIGDDPWV